MTCWFLSFLWRPTAAESWIPGEATTRGEHPIGYMKRLRASHLDHTFRLVFFVEVTPDVYELAQR